MRRWRHLKVQYVWSYQHSNVRLGPCFTRSHLFSYQTSSSFKVCLIHFIFFINFRVNPSVSIIVFCFAFSLFLLFLLIFIILQNYSYLFFIHTTSLFSENTAVSFSKYAPLYSLKYSSLILQFTLTYPFKILLFPFSKYTHSYPLKILIFIH